MLKSGYITGYTEGIRHEIHAAKASAEQLPEAAQTARDGSFWDVTVIVT
jgi:hypothetical protein